MKNKMKMVSTKFASLLLVGLSSSSPWGFAWMPPSSKARSVMLGSLSVASQQTTEDALSLAGHNGDEKEDNNIPYIISRGDGSTGGGGLPMPHSSLLDDDSNGLRRPKVAAEMPKG